MTVRVEVARVYDDPQGQASQYRVLVDRLWPRGVARSALRYDRWAKELAPSTELRRWYGHDPDRFEEFSRRYREELGRPEARTVAAAVREEAKDRSALVLLTATRDVEHSGAVVLAGYLRRKR